MPRKKKILAIYYNPESFENTRVTILHHLKSLDYFGPSYEIMYHNVNEVYQAFALRGNKAGSPPPGINRNWDALILHYSFLSLRTIGWPFRELKKDFSWISDMNCLKVAIPQDEGDYAGILDEWLLELGVTVIFSVHYAPEQPLYPIMRKYAAIYSCLPGYIDEKTVLEYQKKIEPIAERKWDIVYRARRLPAWFGKAGRVKYRIAEIVNAGARKKGFCVDISTRSEDTISGSMWLNFLSSGKTVLGTQGGYSTIDWRGEMKAQVRKILNNNPDISFSQIDEMMPVGWDDHCLFTVTPRHFEAIITNTCQILLMGEYKGILIPNVHYIVLKPDWTNIDEVLERIRDVAAIQKMSDQARKDILESGKYSYQAFAQTLEKILEDHYQQKKMSPFIPNSETSQPDLEDIERELIAQRNELIAFEDHFLRIQQEAIEQVQALQRLVQEYKPRFKKWGVLLLAVLTGYIFILLTLLIILFRT